MMELMEFMVGQHINARLSIVERMVSLDWSLASLDGSLDGSDKSYILYCSPFFNISIVSPYIGILVRYCRIRCLTFGFYLYTYQVLRQTTLKHYAILTLERHQLSVDYLRLGRWALTT